MPNNPSPVAEDMYADTPDQAAPQGENESGEVGETALLPKSMCPGMSPGQEITLKIVSVQDDSYQVAYEKPDAAESAEPEIPQDMDEESMYA